MPHSLYLGSGLAQARLKDYDLRHGLWTHPGSSAAPSVVSTNQPTPVEMDMEEDKYRPSISAIRHCLPYSLTELIFTLVTLALFINS